MKAGRCGQRTGLCWNVATASAAVPLLLLLRDALRARTEPREWLVGRDEGDADFCNIRCVDGGGLDRAALVALLAAADGPVIVENATVEWQAIGAWADRPSFLRRHGELAVAVGRGGVMGADGPESGAESSWVGAKGRDAAEMLALARQSGLLSAGASSARLQLPNDS